jgi:ribose/xylose/arabinose/galactoside ABC-type transport system permease subunit
MSRSGKESIVHEPTVDVPSTPRAEPPPRSLSAQVISAISYKRIGAVYVFVVIAVIFSLWVPDTFPTWDTVRQILNGNAITGLVALAVVVPLTAAIFDLSFAYTMTLTGVTAAHFVSIGWSVAPAMGAALVVALLIGLFNGLIVVRLKIDSFIGTLATGALIQALITFVTGDADVTGLELNGPFAKLASADIGGITLPVFYLLVLALALWFMLRHTATGRRLYATGFNPQAARLASIRTTRLSFYSLLFSSVVAGFAGVILASSVQTGSTTAGTGYLLPAFAAAFLGATQITPGRFNAWGTVIAVLLLGTGVTGLGLAGAPAWTGSMFTGVVLVTALAVASLERRRPEVVRKALRRTRRGAEQSEQ